MKILFVKASHVTPVQPSIIPPLGILYLAGYLDRHRPHHELRMIDLRLMPQSEYERVLAEYRPDVVGISLMTIEAPHAHRCAATARRMLPESTIVFGGPHPTNYVEEVFADPHVDFAVVHEGEITFTELLDAIESRSGFDSVKGIVYRSPSSPKGFVETDARPFVSDLDSLPHPLWSMVDFDLYETVKSMSLIGPRRCAPLTTSRACPYRCSYCHDMFGKKFQKRSVENVLDEIEMIVRQYDVREFEIVDDIFNLDRPRATAILQGIIDRKLGIGLAFPNGLRGDLMDEEMVDLFARAGTRYVSIAVETASPRLQKQIRKNLRIPKIEDTIRWFVERRVYTNCFYMLGFPSETLDEMKATVEFAIRQPSHTSMFFVVVPYKGTTMNAELPDPSVASELEGLSYNEGGINVSGEVSTEEIQRLIKVAYLRIIADPARIWRLLRDHPNKRYLPAMASIVVNRLVWDNLNQTDFVSRLRRAVGLGERGRTLVPRVMRDAEARASAQSADRTATF